MNMSWAPWMLVAMAVTSVVLAASLTGCKTVTTDIVIGAKPATVWRVLSDARRFEEWNPVHVKVEGAFNEGETVRIHVKDGKGKVSAFDAQVRRVHPEHELAQGGGFPGLFTFSHSFRLEPVGEGTRVLHQEKFRGVGVLFVSLDWVEPGYNAVNAALKRRAEALEGGLH
jgi:hypothetical protein